MKILHLFFAEAKSECDCADLDDKHQSTAAMKRDALRPLLAELRRSRPSKSLHFG
jgi:hypothetical protein